MKRMTITALALAGVFVALYLTLYKLGVIGQLSCGTGGCERVNISRWATFLGAPVAVWGVAFYVGAFVVAFASTTERYADNVGPSRLLAAMTGVGVLFSAWLTYLELFVIHAICRYCVVSAIIVTVMFVLSLLDLRDRRPRRATPA